MASGILPQLFARESLRAREFLAQSFEAYFHDGHHLNGSAALLARIDHGVTAGLPAADRARGEVGSSMALVNNTVPAAFWLLYHIFSDPALLAECRAELPKACSVEEDGTRTIDLAYVRSSCPTLNSTLLEVFRYYGIGTVLIRQVVEDHKLNGTYLLKKGSYVLMPNVTQHYSPKIWGSDVSCSPHHSAHSQLTSRRCKASIPSASAPPNAPTLLDYVFSGAAPFSAQGATLPTT